MWKDQLDLIIVPGLSHIKQEYHENVIQGKIYSLYKIRMTCH